MTLYIVHYQAADGTCGIKVTTKLPTKNKLWMMQSCEVVEVEATGKGWRYNSKARRLEPMTQQKRLEK